jgi:hypothetical protein
MFTTDNEDVVVDLENFVDDNSIAPEIFNVEEV